MKEEWKKAFEEARPYLQKIEDLMSIIDECASEEDVRRKLKDLEREDRILYTDLKIFLQYLKREQK